MMAQKWLNQTEENDVMTLRQKQSGFAKMVARLIVRSQIMEYEVTLGDAYRDPRVFGELGKKKGYGHPNSMHKKRLAIDLNLFKNGRYLASTKAHEPLGLWWESIGGSWGGRFGDGNHYEWKDNK